MNKQSSKRLKRRHIWDNSQRVENQLFRDNSNILLVRHNKVLIIFINVFNQYHLLGLQDLLLNKNLLHWAWTRDKLDRGI
jgi:hypothetical protein